MPIIEYFHFSNVSKDTDSVACLGAFDGVHLGHTSLVKKAISLKNDAVSNGKKIRAVALCFSSLPANHFSSNKIKCIMTLSQKLDTFRSLGLDGAYVCDFESICNHSPERFINEILKNECHCVAVVCGFNYRFGAKASGDHETLSAHFDECIKVEPVMLDGVVISSSIIRGLISSGEMTSAAKLLGKPFSIEHEIVHGKNIGIKLGFPTINHIMDQNDEMIVPAFGIYATKVSINDRDYISVTNIGVRPTVSRSGVVTCETHLIDMPKNIDLYGEHAKVSFYKKLRDEKKFESMDALSAAISADVSNTKEYFKNCL